MRNILIGIVLGAFVAFVCIFAVEYAASLLWPLPAGVDPNSAPGSPGMADRMQVAAKLLVVFGWCLGTVAGGAFAGWWAHRRIAAWVVAAIIVANAFWTIEHIPHPTWMVACGLLLPWACAWAVQGIARRRRYRRP